MTKYADSSLLVNDRNGLICISRGPSLERHSLCPVLVVSHRTAPCRSQQTVTLTQSRGTIANVVTMETGCGAPRSPWLIEGRPGQRINLTLDDFSHGVPHVLNAKCYAYAIVRVVVLGRTDLVQQPMFLLKYTVFGCADIQPTQGVWVKRVGDIVTCGCNSSNLRWKLRCQNDSWVGEKYNCSTTGDRLSSSHGFYDYCS
ncbi:hypothetical protein NP493_1050g01010 [Ridgeia piscesae]|uniref:Uncharacterized protein n=1 Tax=Ridgeia piscesae TaxID=27915 RepID=A0AAD9KI62_RIDPI|nr:hypothetical protein NP493_1050g01010 [Ridgeia piscesae]